MVTLKNDAGVTLRKYSYPLKGGPMTNLEGNRPSNVSEFKTVVSDRIMDETVMRDGKPIGNGRYIVEESGKVLTYRRKGTDTQGKPYESSASKLSICSDGTKPLPARPDSVWPEKPTA